jgi:hypothetical protein
MRLHDERGAAAVLIAISLFVLMGFAALAIDLSVGFNERRQDQTAADVGVMAGAVDTLASNITIRDQILDFTRRNVVSEYTDAEWQALWEACEDSERADINSEGFRFMPAPAPSGWSTPSGDLDCISFDGGGYVRAKLPSLAFDTSFGRVLGVEELETSADAIASIGNRGGGGILPFGLLSTAADGQHACLRDASGGHAEEPCDGPDSGNFGALESPHYGTRPDGPSQNCTGSPKKDVLAVNIAYGIDHRITLDADGNPSNEVVDTCAKMDNGLAPDTLNTFTGLSNGTQEGLATGPVPGSIIAPRLQQGGNPKRSVYGSPLDNKPLWEYIDPGVTSGVPANCHRSSFAPSPINLVDWDGDGTLDEHNSWEHLSACLKAYTAGGHATPMFLESLEESPRFAYVPQFWESTFGSGNSWRHVLRFKATWLQATWWRKGGTTTVFHPGEPGSFTGGGNWSLVQLSGILIPEEALPAGLVGNPPSAGGTNPFEPQLFR